MANTKMWKKGLVVGIIVLFISIAVSPSINAGITVKKDIRETIETSDRKDDCNCKPISSLHLVILERLSNKLDRLLDRVEVYTGIISILYKQKPESIEEFKELSNDIITLQDSNNDLKSVFEFGLKDIICDALDSMFDPLLDYGHYLEYLMEENPKLIPIIYPLYFSIAIVLVQIFFLYYGVFFCEDPLPW